MGPFVRYRRLLFVSPLPSLSGVVQSLSGKDHLRYPNAQFVGRGKCSLAERRALPHGGLPGRTELGSTSMSERPALDRATFSANLKPPKTSHYASLNPPGDFDSIGALENQRYLAFRLDNVVWPSAWAGRFASPPRQEAIFAPPGYARRPSGGRSPPVGPPPPQRWCQGKLLRPSSD